ncbi:hypothetical protein ACIQF6_28895 [Kitasatospora sp. NPDC092948]|uniref:hypothetical protein n=1 Tax=Kitasatospora sp. NPDC092948 TaxID=3364088 RepID=UPI003825FB6C
MNGAAFIASVIATGRLHGIGIGSPIADVDRAFRSRWIDDVDEPNLSLRRDYGLVELYFNGPEWVVVGGSVELHRLATVDGLAEEWQKSEGVEFSEYLAWSEVETALAHLPDAPALTVDHRQSGYVEYRAQDLRVSALVVDSHEERDDWPGHGDVFSVALG